MKLRNKKEYQAYQDAAKISVEILRSLYEFCTEGVTTLDIDTVAFESCKKYKVDPAFYHVAGIHGPFHHASCIYLNDVAVHGMPSDQIRVQSGDLVKLDFGIIYQGFYTDHCVSVGVGKVSENNVKLLKVGRDAVIQAALLATSDHTIGDLGSVMEHTARLEGFDTIKQYIGHGIGKKLHEQPEIPAYGKKGRGLHLEEGQVICVEAQVVAGSPDITVEDDGWTVRMSDGKNAVMFEYMMLVGGSESEFLTDTRTWELTKN